MFWLGLVSYGILIDHGTIPIMTRITVARPIMRNTNQTSHENAVWSVDNRCPFFWRIESLERLDKFDRHIETRQFGDWLKLIDLIEISYSPYVLNCWPQVQKSHFPTAYVKPN
jgi:hypothetical protein